MKTSHPIALILYFLALAVYGMTFTHPAYLLAIFVTVTIGIITLKAHKRWKNCLLMCAVMAMAILIINAVVSRNGNTLLPKIGSPLLGDFFVSKEAVFYGLNMGLKISLIINIFFLLDSAAAPDKLLTVFSRVMPKSSIFLILTSLMIPQMKKTLSNVSYSMKARGAPLDSKSIFVKIKAHLPLVKVLLLSSLEGSWETTEALHARAFGLGQKTSYKTEKWKSRDTILAILLLISIAGFIKALILNRGFYTFYPTMGTLWNTSDLAYIAWIVLPLLPMVTLSLIDLLNPPAVLRLPLFAQHPERSRGARPRGISMTFASHSSPLCFDSRWLLSILSAVEGQAARYSAKANKKKMELLKLKNLKYFYPDTANPALNIEDLCIEIGDFLLVVGPSGGGKSTLARLLGGFIQNFYGGTICGKISFRDKPISQWETLNLRRHIGMIFQDPEKQIIMGDVERDLAFGLENLGLDRHSMIQRVSETIERLRLKNLKNKNSSCLSSGQKQKVAIASILAMKPEVLILDEPLSQLDPEASFEILSTLVELNRKESLTVILIEQRLEECFHLATKVLLVDGGKIILKKTPQDFAKKAFPDYKHFIPPSRRFFSSSGPDGIPLSSTQSKSTRSFADLKHVSHSYNGSERVLKGVNLTINRGEFLSIIGENGAGKSTLLKIVAGIIVPDEGEIFIKEMNSKNLSIKERAKLIGYLSQNPNDYLFNDTVEDELAYTAKNLRLDNENIEKVLEYLELDKLRKTYPRDLSTGQRQRVALGSILVANPSLIMLDEPTRGLDRRLKIKLGQTLKDLTLEKNSGVILVTQDSDFAYEFSDRMILLSDGMIVKDGPKDQIFSEL